MEGAFWTHTIGGVHSDEAEKKLKGRQAREEMSVRGNNENSSEP